MLYFAVNAALWLILVFLIAFLLPIDWRITLGVTALIAASGISTGYFYLKRGEAYAKRGECGPDCDIDHRTASVDAPGARPRIPEQFRNK